MFQCLGCPVKMIPMLICQDIHSTSTAKDKSSSNLLDLAPPDYYVWCVMLKAAMSEAGLLLSTCTHIYSTYL